ncbi:unnamed protein product, partial [Allacma fusca]
KKKVVNRNTLKKPAEVMDEERGSEPGHVDCLLCFTVQTEECNWSTSDKRKMFEAFCCLLSINLPDNFSWNFENEAFPFCNTCIPFLQELVILFDQLQGLHRKLELVVSTIGGVFTSSMKEIPFTTTTATPNGLRTVSKFQYFTKQLQEVFSNDEDSVEIVISQVSAQTDASKQITEVGEKPNETSNGFSWIEIKMKDTVPEDTTSGFVSTDSSQKESANWQSLGEKVEDLFSSKSPSAVETVGVQAYNNNENASTWVSRHSDLHCNGNNFCEVLPGSKFESILVDAISPSNSPEYIGKSKHDPSTKNEYEDKCVMEMGKRESLLSRTKYNETLECGCLGNAQHETDTTRFSTEDVDRDRRSKKLRYLMEDGINWDEKLVQCPKPAWTAIFSSHGFTYAGISVLSAERGFQCSVCNSKWRNMDKAIDHLEYEHLGFDHWYPCNRCRQIFRCTRGLQLHNEMLHPGESTLKWNFLCETCSKRFCSKDLLYQHMQIHLSFWNTTAHSQKSRIYSNHNQTEIKNNLFQATVQNSSQKKPSITACQAAVQTSPLKKPRINTSEEWQLHIDRIRKLIA